MKKGFIFATTLAMALGVGVAVGAHQNKAARADAGDGPATTTLYCKMTYDWWKDGNAAIAAHYWGGTSGTTWPGERMTKVDGDTDVWKITIPSDHENIVFVRTNESGNVADWGAQTEDLSIPTDEKKLYTITSSTAKWSGEGHKVTGEWSEYVEPTPEPVDENYYLKGSINDWTVSDEYKFTVDSEDANHYTLEGVELAVGDEIKGFQAPDHWYGVASAWQETWEVATEQGHEGNLKVKTADTYTVNLYVNSDDHNHLSLVSETPPEPVDENYYLKGSINDWTVSDEYKFTVDSEDANHYTLEGVELAVGDEIKGFQAPDHWYGVASAWQETWEVATEQGHEGNLKVKTADTYTVNLYVNSDDGNHLSLQSEDVPEEDGYYVVGTKSNWHFAGATKMITGGEHNDKAHLLNYLGKAGEKFKVRSYFDGVATWYGDEDYIVGDEDKALDIYVNEWGQLYVSGHIEQDVPAEDGYYLISSKTNYKYAGATKMQQVLPELTGNVAVIIGYEAEENERIKARSFFNEVDKYSENSDGVKAYGHEDEDHNFMFTVAGEYDIYAYYNDDAFLFSVAEHVEHVNVTLAAKMFDGSHSQGEVTIAQFPIVKGETYTIVKMDREGYVQLKTYTDFDCTIEYDDEEPIESNIMLHVKYMEIGYYVISEAGGWSIENATKMLTSGIADTNKAEANLTVAEAGEKYSFVFTFSCV